MRTGAWPSERLKHVADVAYSSVDKRSVDGEVPVRLCNYTDVYYQDEITSDLPFMEATATPDQVRRFGLREGDVLITKDSESAEDIGVPAFVAETLADVVCGYHLAVLRPRRDKVEPRFLYWSVMGNAMHQQMTAAASGVTRFALRHADVANIELMIPDLDVQRAIVRLLDSETARLDALIASKFRLVRMLDERRLSLLGQFLAPAGAVTLNSSKLVRLKWLVTEFLAGGTPRTDEARYWSDDEAASVPWVTITDMVERGVTSQTARRVTLKGLASARLRIGKPGTILLAMYASVGKMSLLGVPACWNQAILGITPDPSAVLPTYISCWLEFLRPRLSGLVRSNTQDNLNAEQVGNLRVLLPRLPRQLELVERLESEFARSDRLTLLVRRQVDKLRQHRLALITTRVTGDADGRVAGVNHLGAAKLPYSASK